ncbi:MAG: ArsR family transcriptional regulator [Desulfobacteraceae bacterium]|nr:MAG: ArsR family transcriptional regulator [Desulfobacteraceae bacterium]
MTPHLKNLLRVSKALADETRLRLVSLLLDHDLCGRALSIRLGISQPAVSQHLKVLKAAGLITAEKRGYWTHYGIERKRLVAAAQELQRIAHRSAFPGSPCQRTASFPGILEKKEDRTMCCQSCCENPKKLRDKPETCSAEQIRECHGDTGTHPCTDKKKAENS